LTTLEKPGGAGEFGKYFSLPALNDPRIGESLILVCVLLIGVIFLLYFACVWCDLLLLFHCYFFGECNVAISVMIDELNLNLGRLRIDGDIRVFGNTDRLPYSVRILLESAIRNCDEFQVKSNDVEKIIDWENTSPKLVEIPFKPARVLLQVSNMKMLMPSGIAFVKFFECLLYFVVFTEVF